MKNCACGKPLHYTDPNLQKVIEDMVQNLGEYIKVTVENKTYLVQRHYIALHGLKAAELPNLGFVELPK